MMISNLPTVYEVVTGSGKKQSKPPNSNGKSKSGSKVSTHAQHNMLCFLFKYSHWFLTIRSFFLQLQPSKKPNSNSKPAKQPLPKQEEQMVKEEGGDKDQAYLCGTCGGSYSNNGEFWIGCDICENWYHGNCVRITPAKAEHIKQYKCPACSNKRSRE